MMSRRIAFILFALLLPACSQPAPPSNLPVIDAKIGKLLYRLEVASTPDEMEHGLMNRTSMPKDHGMIFVFPKEQELSFWMKNTLIPLDILFLDSNNQVISIAHMKPAPPNLPDDQIPTTRSNGLAKYAIELNEDAAMECGIHSGDTVLLPTPKPAQ